MMQVTQQLNNVVTVKTISMLYTASYLRGKTDKFTFQQMIICKSVETSLLLI